MKVRLDISPNAEIRVIEDDGVPTGIEITPRFTSKTGVSVGEKAALVLKATKR